MKIYIGPQIGLSEFDGVDLSISWLDEPVVSYEPTLVGNENVAFLLKNGEILKRIEDFSIENLKGVNFGIAVGNDAKYPEFFHYAKSRGANIVVVYEKASNVSELIYIKNRAWVHSQESSTMVISIVKIMDSVRYNVYGNMEKFDNFGVILESGSPAVMEVSP